MTKSNHNPVLIAITGGPGSGKTTFVEALAEAGYTTVPEAGRAILQEQRKIDGNATHEGDRKLYADLQLDRCIRDYHTATALDGPVWFDRSIVDVYGYCLLIDLPVSDALKRACADHRYAGDTLLTPHWPEIYRNDDLRRQDEAEAAATCEVMREAYARCGYRIVELPKASVADRVTFARTHYG